MKKLALGLVAVAVLMVPAMARAGIQSYSIGFAFDITPGANQAVQLSLFNDAGGTLTLTQVDLSFTGTIGATVEIENDSGSPGTINIDLIGGTLQATETSPGSLDTGSVALAPTTASHAVAASIGPVRGGADYWDFGTLSDTDSGTDFTTTGLAVYIGPGNMDVTVFGSGAWSASGTSSSTLWLQNFQGTGTVTVDYTYTPEPATIGLMGIGLASLVARRRKRRYK